MPRPAPDDPPVQVGRLPRSQVEALDREAARLGVSRQALLSRLLGRAGLLDGGDLTPTPKRSRARTEPDPATVAAGAKAHKWIDHPVFGKMCEGCHQPRRAAGRYCPRLSP